MRGAFIVQLGPETKPDEGRFEGWVQEVDLCKEVRFHNSEELLQFLGERFEVAKTVAEKARSAKESGPPRLSSKRTRKEET
jgi:chorismate mutase